MRIKPIIYDQHGIIVGHYLNRDYLTIYINNNYGSSANKSKEEIVNCIDEFCLNVFGAILDIRSMQKNHVKLFVDTQNHLKYYEKYSSYMVDFFGAENHIRYDNIKQFYGSMHGLQEKYVSSIFYRDYTMLNYNTAMRTLYDVHVFLNERVKYKEFIRL